MGRCLGAGACAQQQAGKSGLPSSTSNTITASAFWIWLQASWSISPEGPVKTNPQKLNKGSVHLLWEDKNQASVNRLCTFWPDFAGRIYLLRSLGAVYLKTVSMDHLVLEPCGVLVKKAGA